MAKRGFGREMWQRALTSPYLLLLFVASILLSIASFYTTYEGITPFVRFPAIAFFITTAIQSLLFVVSWRLGFMFAGKEDVAWVDVGVFLVCFLLSVFFSFNSLFNMIFVEERQQEASLGRTRDGAVAVVDHVERRLKDNHARQIDDLRASDAYATWRRDVLAIADAAQRAGPQLRERVTRQQAQKQEEYERKAEASRDLVARKGSMQEEITALERELAAFDSAPPDSSDLEDLRQQVRELELEISAKQAEMAAEEEGIAASGRSGRGPEWREKDKERRVLSNQQQGLEEKIRIRLQQIQGHEQQRQELVRTLLKTQELHANIDAEIERRRAEAARVRHELEDFGADGNAETVQTLREYPNRFEERADVTQLEQAEGLCTRLADELEALAVDLAGKSCDRGPIMGTIAPIAETSQALADLDRQCLGDTAPSLHRMDFATALATARQCLDLSRLPYREVRDLRETLDRLEREEGPHASDFTKTTNALLAGEKDGYLALVLALAMDLLVLFTGLIGAKSATATFATQVWEVDRQDDPEIAAIKTLLKHLDPFDRKIGGTRYEAKIDLEQIPDPRTRDAVGMLLVRNRATGLVLASAEEPGLYFLRYGAQEQLEGQLEKRRRPGGAQSPTATGGPRRATWASPGPPTHKRARQVREPAPFYVDGERSSDHHDPYPLVERAGPGVAGSGSGDAKDPASSPGDPAAGGPAGDPGGARPGGRAAPAAAVAATDTGSPGPESPPATREPDRDAPGPATAAAGKEPDEDLELVYEFLHGNEPGKPPSADA